MPFVASSRSTPYPPPLVSIVIPTRNQPKLLSTCISSIRAKTTYSPYEIIVIDNQTDDDDALKYINSITADGTVSVIRYAQPFNYSAMNNLAAQQAKGAILVFMNNDIEVITPGWLEELVSLAATPQHGAVGAMLYYPDNTIQHAGVSAGKGGIASHDFKGQG